MELNDRLQDHWRVVGRSWEVILPSGRRIDNISDLQPQENGSLSIWLHGRRLWRVVEGRPDTTSEPDLVLASGAWLAYRPIPSTQEP